MPAIDRIFEKLGIRRPGPGRADHGDRYKNIEYNRNLFNHYARYWTKESTYLDNPLVADRETYLQYIGDEWGRAEDLPAIIDDMVRPFVGKSTIAAEIGSGGGRMASKVAPLVGRLTCFDIAEAFLEKAKQALAEHRNIDYVLLGDKLFEPVPDVSFDFIYSFDVLVHLDLHTLWRYFTYVHRILKKDGLFFAHTTNLRAPGGWANFSDQQEYTVEGHYFIVPEIVDLFCEKAGFAKVRVAPIDTANFYYNRDYLCILRKV